MARSSINRRRKWEGEHDFRTTLRASVRLLMLEAGDVDQPWVQGQLEEMLARHGLKDFEL